MISMITDLIFIISIRRIMFFDWERYYISLITTIDETKICYFVSIGFYKSKMLIFNDKPSTFVNIIILF